MPGDENIIEETAVKVSPDLKGFGKELTTKVDKEAAKVTAKVKLVPDLGKGPTGFAALAKAKLEKINLTAKVKLVADGSGFVASARGELRKQAALAHQPTYKIKLVADGRGFGGTVRDALKNQRDIVVKSGIIQRQADGERIQQNALTVAQIARQEERAAAAKVRADEQRARQEARLLAQLTRQEERAAAVQKRANEQRARENAKILKQIAAQEERAARKQEREVAESRKALARGVKAPGLIDFGGKGFRPQNILMASLVALTPALLAVSTRALQAGSSLAFLGSAAVGAASGITGIVISLGRVSDAMALRSAIRNEDALEAANSAKTAVQAADDEAAAQDRITDAMESAEDARRGLADAQRDEYEAQTRINVARKEAIQDLKDLRELVSDLAREESGAKLSLEEAESERDSVYRNFFATDLERRQADQAVADAEDRLSDTRRERRQKLAELRQSISGGVNKSEKVVNARREAEAARRRTSDAKRAVVRADRGVTQARKARGQTSTGAAGSTVSAAQAQLDRLRADMSQAARDMDDYLAAQHDRLLGLRGRIENLVLPELTAALKFLIEPPKGGKSTLEILADDAGRLGGIITYAARKLAAFTQTPLFRAANKTIMDENAKSFYLLADAAVTLVRPLTRITAAAAPLFTKFSAGALEFATWLDKVIEAADESGDLARWFEDAATAAGQFADMAKNLLTFLGNVFKLSLPTGDSLMQQLVTMTEKLSTWSSSADGQARITKFFEFFRDLPYGDIRDFLIQAAGMFTAMRLVPWALANPFFAALGILATSNPAAAAGLMGAVNNMITSTLGFLASHPTETAALLTILSAVKLAQAGGVAKIGVRLVGMTALGKLLTSKFEPFRALLGAKTVASMVVHAGSVVVNGRSVVGGVPGNTKTGPGGTPLVPVPASGTPTTEGTKGGLKNKLRGVGRGGVAAAVAFLAAEILLADVDPKIRSFLLSTDDGTSGLQDDGTYVGSNGTVMYTKEQWEKKQAGTLPDLRDKVNRVKIRSLVAAETAMEGVRYRAKNAPSTTGIRVNNEGDANSNRELQKAIQLRGLYVAEIQRGVEKTKGANAAHQEFIRLNQESKKTLTDTMIALGWTEDAAKAYADQIYKIPETAKTTAKFEKTEAEKDIGVFGEKVDAVTGVRYVTVVLKGKEMLFKDLTTAVAYQQLIKKSIDPTETNINKIRNQILNKNTGGGTTDTNLTPKATNKARGGYITGPGTTTSDSIPAWLSDEEYVMPAKAVRKYGVATFDAMRAERAPMPDYAPMYAAGGLVGGGSTSTWPFVMPMPVKEVKAQLDAVRAGGSPGGAGGVPGGNVPGGTWQQLWALFHGKFPSSNLFSAYRRSRTRSGNWSRHSYGKAIDVSPIRAAAEWIYNTFGKNTYELITPWRDLMLYKGKHHKYSSQLEYDHGFQGPHPHIHWSSYDTGGKLAPGYNLAYNGTGSYETVRTAQQERQLEQKPAAGNGGAYMRLDDRDIARLAQHIAMASANQSITMDGRKVAEVVRSYDYMPGRL